MDDSKNLQQNKKSPHASLKFILITCISLLLFIIILLSLLYYISIHVGYMYAVIIDAGSTSSKISVMRWQDFPFRSNGYVEEQGMVKVEPGISDSKNNPEEAFQHIKPKLQSFIIKKIPQHKRNESSLYLGATAGMRIINLESPMATDAIFDDLRHNLPSLGLKVHNVFSDIRMISGKSEGKYAWITVNYLANKLGNAQGLKPNLPENMIGALDLGGASTQITFVPEMSQASSKHIFSQFLFGKQYQIYSYSYLCYGKSMAEKRVWAEIINNSSSKTISNPCLLLGYNLQVNKNEIFTDPCITSKFAKQIFGYEIIPNENLPEIVEFKGTGDANACRNFAQRIFPQKQCKLSTCMFNGVYRPPIRGKFYAFAGFTYVMEFLESRPNRKSMSRDEFRKRINKLCSTSWSTIENTYPKNQHKFIAKFCFDGGYIDALLSNYGFNTSKSWEEISFVKKVAGVSVSWALGYVIEASGKIDSEAPKIDLSFEAFLGSVIFLSILLIVLVLALLIIYMRR